MGQLRVGKIARVIFKEWLPMAVMVIVFWVLFYMFIARTYTVDGLSMYPTFCGKERVLVSPLSYDLGSPEQGDVVVIQPPKDYREQEERKEKNRERMTLFQRITGGGIFYIKRIVGLPGDKLLFRGNVFLSQNGGPVLLRGNALVARNGKPVSESYVNPSTEWMASSMNEVEVTVPAGSVYVMGDNRDHSTDSRVFGPVLLEDVKGKVIFNLWPLDRIGTLSPCVKLEKATG